MAHRKDKIREEDHEKVFNADVFLGDQTKELGLVDEIGHLDSKMKEMYPEAEIVNFSKESPMEAFKRKFGSADSSFGMMLKMMSHLKTTSPN